MDIRLLSLILSLSGITAVCGYVYYTVEKQYGKIAKGPELIRGAYPELTDDQKN